MMGSIKSVFIFTVITCHVGMVTAVVTSAPAGEKNFQKEVQKSMSWKIGYDTDGRVNKVTDPGDKETAFKYSFEKADGAGQIERVHADGTHVTYEFDNKGRCTRMKDTHGQVNYKYDLGGNITSVQRDKGPAVQYTYNTLNRMKRMEVGGKFWIEYSYDYLGRISAMTTTIGKIEYQYHSAQGLVVRTLPNGVQTHWEYNPDGSLKSITHAWKDRQILSQYTYSYRPDDLISEIKEWDPQGGRVVRYEYDKVQRLVVVEDSRRGKVEYSYDKLGNRTELKAGGKQPVSSTYDWAGRMLSWNSHTCSHDGSGNLISYGGSNGRGVFEFNHMNLLKSAKNNGASIEYNYDGDGYLLARTAAGKRTSFVPNPQTDNWNPLLTIDSDGKKTFYVWDGQSPLMAMNGKDVKFFLNDHLGSVRCVLDKKGEIVKLYDFSSFGVPEHNLTGTDLIPGFAGLFFDQAASLYLTRARAYDPEFARFLQPDPEHRVPMGSQKDLSVYAYCGGDPVNFVDLNGARPAWTTGTYWATGGKLLLDLFDPTGTIFDPTSAKQWYAEASERATSQAAENGNWGWAGTKATLYDLAGGYIPGKHYNRGQELASVAWSLAGGLGSAPNINYSQLYHPGSIQKSFKAISAARTIASPFVKASEGDTLGVVEDIAWMGFGKLTDFTSAKSFDYLTSNLTRTNLDAGRRLKTLSDGMKIFKLAHTYGTKPYKVTQIYQKYPVGGGGGPSGSGFNKGIISQRVISGVNLDPGPPKPPYRRMRDEYDDIKYGTIWGGDDGGPGGGGSGFSPMSPSNVGGVYLRGAGDSLKDLGMLSGIAVDDKNGRLVLLSEDDKQVSLPPLRMDDVVTVFRSVYEHGEAPFVSIDPDPNDPNGPIMLTRHGKATKDSYVGWILFESDRVMKGYSLGTDNVTRQKIESNIPEYQSILDAGLDDANDNAADGPIWERFWIVPAKVDHRISDSGDITLFDVPLKVMTQRMVMKDGKLEPAPNASPSQQAKDFCAWFTKNYDDLGKEVLSVPPKETGITKSVSFYEELRRIALITAIAERLRDQGVPMPNWMRTYKVTPCALVPTTPAINVEATKSNESTITENGERKKVVNTQTNRIYGGVRLAAEDKNVSTQENDAKAQSVADKLWDTVDLVPSFSPVDVSVDNQDLRAVALPGNDTQDVGANTLVETDIVVPVRGSHRINITRHFNSFFEPKGELGTSWTLDLPTLQEHPIPVERTGDSTKYSVGYQLTGPLGRVSEVFQKKDYVEAVSGELLVPESTSSDYWGIGNSKSDRTGSDMTVVMFKDGREWRFNDQGDLAEVCEGPSTTQYSRDDTGRIMQIVGWHGKQPIADINLHYDQANRIQIATGSNGVKAKYEYDQEGHLANVSISFSKDEKETEIGSMGYQYDKGLVTAISINGQEVNKFAYGTQGRVLSTQSQDSKVTYDINSQADGVQVVTSSENGSHSIQYDDAFRPVKQAYTNGTQVEWEYDEAGKRAASIKSSDGEQYSVTYDDIEKQLTLSTPEGSQYATLHDEAGRPVEQKVNGETVLRQQWHPNGLAGSTYNETCAVRPEYDQDSIQTGFMITPPEDQKSYRQWTHVQYDALGRTKEITDASGEQTQLGYDENGQLNVVSSQRGGVQVDRDDAGRVTSVRTTWGDNQQNHFDPQTGILSKIALVSGENGNHKASVNFDESGRFSSIQQFDGGVTKLGYHTDGNGKDMVKDITTPNGLGLNYQYDEKQRLATVACGETYRLGFEYDEEGRLVGLSQSPLRGN